MYTDGKRQEKRKDVRFYRLTWRDVQEVVSESLKTPSLSTNKSILLAPEVEK